MSLQEKICLCLENVKEKRPLLHHITNYVTVTDCANMVLAIGASPVMADDIAEVEEMVGFASALVINIGTLNARTIESMLAAGKKAKVLGIPVILDPVGVGATKLRTATTEQIIREIKPDVIRGNMSEIKVLSGLEVAIKGVDSLADEQDGGAVAKELAQKLGCIIAITGKTDYISDGTRLCMIDNGHKMLADITGTGCMTTSLVGAFCGANSDYFTATIAGITAMGLSGELAHASLSPEDGIGTFKTKLYDNIYNLTPERLSNGGKFSCE